ARCELEAFVREVDETAAEMGIAFLGLGFHPFSDFHRIDAVPKHRYKIMAPYLGHRGHLAHGMMKATAGCQINLDYSSEDDAMEKMRVAMGVSSLVTAMCANSPLARGKESGFLSLRSHIWMHTDPDRCGLLPFVFRDQARFSDYADYALGVPMLFVVREGRWIDMTACTFRSFLEGGFRGLSATLDDWELHLTTLFPEVRLKSWLELRGSDSGPPDMILAQATLWKALLYDQRARRAAWRLVAGASPEQRLAFHRAVPRSGLHAKLAGRPAMELALELLEIAQEPLPPDEIALLDPLVRTVRERRRTPAEDILSHWSGAWAHDPRRLVASLAPDPRPRGT
ncbi:MAG: glutamate--cysteine ligase, partial [Acidobacteriota bacterium]